MTPVKLFKFCSFLLCLSLPLLGRAAASDTLPYYAMNTMKVSESITPETTELLGERLDLATGSLTFGHTDVSLGGTNGMDISISRAWRSRSRNERDYDMADWEFEIPHIRANVLQDSSGIVGSPWGEGHQCSGPQEPGDVEAGSYTDIVRALEYYDGINLVVPGVVNDKVSEFESAPWIHKTKSNWRLKCITRADGEEGYLAQSPDGLTYKFDIPVIKKANTIVKNHKAVYIYYYYLYVSKIKDRFGNEISFNYQDGKLTRVSSTDGRVVTIAYNANNYVESVTTPKGVWGYEYTQFGNSWLLSNVNLPDGSAWSFDFHELITLNNKLELMPDEGPYFSCYAKDSEYVAEITHPYGTKGIFTVRPTTQWRTGVPLVDGAIPSTRDCFVAASVASKTLEIPGKSPIGWRYQYSQNAGAYTNAPEEAVGISHPVPTWVDSTEVKSTSVFAPDGSKTVYIFSRNFDETEGFNYRTAHYDTDGTTLLRYVDHQGEMGTCSTSIIFLTGNPWPQQCGMRTTKDVTTEFSQSTQTTFSTEYSDFNDYDKPTVVKEYNSISSAWNRTSASIFEQYDSDNAAYQLLNVVAETKLSTNGGGPTTVAETDYYLPADAEKYLPKEKRMYGVWVNRYYYHSNGELKKIEYNRPTDQNVSQWIKYSNYKQGIAQSISLPSPTGAGVLSASMVVGNDGRINSVTNLDQVTTNYDYDSLGRLELIDYSGPFASVNLNFQQASSTELASLGLPAGLYKRTRTLDALTETNYFDGLLRPILTVRADTNSGIKYYKKQEFDHYGGVIFESYWSDSAAITDGILYRYDGLGRQKEVTQTVDQTSVTTDYLSNNRVRKTDPRGNSTTTSYLAYGSPTNENATSISAPEGVLTTLNYNLFDNVTAITQGGVTESRYYDSYQRLCRVARPETGSTVYSYLSGGQLAWQAKGLSLTGSGCQTAAATEADKISFEYDNHGNSVATLYPDATPDIISVYDNLGQLTSVSSSDGSSWTYDYNELGLLEHELLTVGSYSFHIQHDFNVRGDESSLTYPSNVTVDYAPDAFGRPTKVGSYASNVTYHPNGSVHSFVYGNGIVHTTNLNSRQLPEVLSEKQGSTILAGKGLIYDDAGNISDITDLHDNYYNLSLGYDGLNRLTEANGPWGLGSIEYDLLGNIKYKTLGDQQLSYQYNATTNRLATVTGATNKSFSYDNQGNVTGNGERTFEFNKANQLEASGDLAFTYDGHNRRITSTGGGEDTFSVYSLRGQLLHKLASTGTSYDYLYLGSRMVARDDHGAQQLPPSAAPTLTIDTTVGAIGDVALTWSGVSGAAFYLLQQQDNGHWLSRSNSYETTASVTFTASGDYPFRVAACNTAGCGPFSPVQNASILFAPVAPGSITVPSGTQTSGSYTVSWSSVGYTNSYSLQRRKDAGSWANVYTGSATNKSISGQTNGSYRYRVKACNSVGCSSYKTSASFTVLLPPAVPASLAVPTSVDGDGAFTVSWSASATATSYQLQRQFNGGSWVAIANQAGTSVNRSGLADGNYLYRVKACNVTCSGWKTSTTVTVLHPPTVPGSITVPSSTNTSGSYTISWAAVSGATSYQLREQKDGGSWVLVHNGSAASKSLSGKTSGSYKYNVRACNAGGCSADRTSGSFTVLLPPAAPSSITVPTSTDADGTFTVSWSSAATATSYQLQQRLNGGSWATIANQAGTSVARSNLANGSYVYRVKACNLTCSGWKTSTSVTVLHPPAAPSLTLPTLVGDGNFTVSWSSVNTATSYVLQRKIGSGSYSNVYSGNATSQSYSNQTENSYSFRVHACNASGCSGWATKTVVVDYPIINSLTLNPTVLSTPGSFTIFWSSSNTIKCKLTFDGGVLYKDNLAASSSTSAFASTDTNVTVTCSYGSRSASKSAKITVKYDTPGL
ncbi:hypothetical protein [Halioxenophilus sp. WMMB6]|uniref:hypothetical protein n=1 Tax=Halioxenophilus sp. WMMB6 TaxID=3073815 RepID=UPI00295E8315|nr:hypothetical protein [Halioxenophilus sp. WMMB6]